MKKLLLIALIAMSGCNRTPKVNIPYEDFTLPNGLHVILAQDHSDPIVAVAIQYHVGAAREKPGKTGFAHFFEHMLFQRSENLPRNAFFQKIAAMGGDFNGGTNSDGTIYYEVVPRDALEKVLWMESDRMGFFINTVTQDGLEREIDVVSNEKRERYDTRPYGQVMPIFSKYAYPEGHPYSWTTIGELPDLRAATIDDVKEFYTTYYKPNNATLVIAGDFDPAQTRALVEKYFSEIAAGQKVEKRSPMPAPLAEPVRVMHRDAYASTPLLALFYPGVEEYHPDSYALQMLASVLSEGKNSPLYKVIVDERKLAADVSMYAMGRELAGNMIIEVQAFEGVDLNELRAAIDQAYARFEAEGFDEALLDGFKALGEMRVYNRMGGILNRAQTMAGDDVFGGDPLRTFDDLKKSNAVGKREVIAAFDKYIKGRPALEVSIVPAAAPELALEGSREAELSVEKITDQSMKATEGELVDDDYLRSESSFDRSIEPELLANTPALNPPAIWRETLSNGLRLWGATNDEMPVVRFSLTIRGGLLRDQPEKVGLASLYASTLLAGTATKTPEEFEAALKRLGASVSSYAGAEAITISGSVLSRNLQPTLDLVAEAIAEPRFDAGEIEKARQSALQQIAQQADDAESIAWLAMDRLLYAGTIFEYPSVGTAASVNAITPEDLKAFHATFTAPNIADLNIAGAVSPEAARAAAEPLASRWSGQAPAVPTALAMSETPATPRYYFIDQPGAQQSYILVSRTTMPLSSPDFYPAFVANYRLGNGSQSLLFDELRLKRGYTYGAYSGLMAGNLSNCFYIGTRVQGTRTSESVAVIRDILAAYPTIVTDDQVEQVRAAMLKSQLGDYETLTALNSMLRNISSYGLPEDYVKQREAYLRSVTGDQLREAIRRHIDPQKMTWVVVGDAATQLPKLSEFWELRIEN